MLEKCGSLSFDEIEGLKAWQDINKIRLVESSTPSLSSSFEIENLVAAEHLED